MSLFRFWRRQAGGEYRHARGFGGPDLPGFPRPCWRAFVVICPSTPPFPWSPPRPPLGHPILFRTQMVGLDGYPAFQKASPQEPFPTSGLAAGRLQPFCAR